jgi:hypothetical protein
VPLAERSRKEDIPRLQHAALTMHLKSNIVWQSKSGFRSPFGQRQIVHGKEVEDVISIHEHDLTSLRRVELPPS